MNPPEVIIGPCLGEKDSPCPRNCAVYTPNPNGNESDGTLGNCMMCGCPNHIHGRYYADETDDGIIIRPYSHFFSSMHPQKKPTRPTPETPETQGYEALSQASQASKVTPSKRSLSVSAKSQQPTQRPQYVGRYDNANSSRQSRQVQQVQHSTISTSDQQVREGLPTQRQQYVERYDNVNSSRQVQHSTSDQQVREGLSHRIGAQSAKKKRKGDPSQQCPSIGRYSAIKFFGRTDGLKEQDIIQDSVILSHSDPDTLSSQGIHLVNDHNVKEILKMENIDKLMWTLENEVRRNFGPPIFLHTHYGPPKDHPDDTFCFSRSRYCWAVYRTTTLARNADSFPKKPYENSILRVLQTMICEAHFESYNSMVMHAIINNYLEHTLQHPLQPLR